MAPRPNATSAPKEVSKSATDQVLGSRVEKTVPTKRVRDRVIAGMPSNATELQGPSDTSKGYEERSNAGETTSTIPHADVAAAAGAESTQVADDSKTPMTKEDEVIVGDGSYRRAFQRVTVDKTWKDLLKGSSKAVTGTAEYFASLKAEAGRYSVLEKSTVIETSDGEALAYFIKGGMLEGMAAEEGAKTTEISVKVIEDLLKVYKSKKPVNHNSRHQGDFKEIRNSWADKGQQYGEHQFAWWHMRGHPHEPAFLSRGCKPGAKKALAGVKTYLDVTAWEHHQVSAWMKALEPECWEEQSNMYHGLRNSGALEHFDQGEKGCHAGLVLLANVTVSPHRDKEDVKDGFTAVYCWGSFKGADQVFPDIRYKIRLEPGDLMMAHYALLVHWVEEIQEGYRFGLVRFTRGDILRYKEPQFFCHEGQCKAGFSKLASLKSHWRGTSREKQKHTYTLEKIQELLVRYGYKIAVGAPAARTETLAQDKEEEVNDAEDTSSEEGGPSSLEEESAEEE